MQIWVECLSYKVKLKHLNFVESLYFNWGKPIIKSKFHSSHVVYALFITVVAIPGPSGPRMWQENPHKNQLLLDLTRDVPIRYEYLHWSWKTF